MKKVPCAVIDASACDGSKDASEALAKAAADGFVVKMSNPDGVLLLQKPTNLPNHTTLLGLNMVFDMQQGPWCDLTHCEHVYMYNGSMTSKCKMHCPIITGIQKRKEADEPQPVFIDEVKWGNIVLKENEDKTELQFVTYP